MRALIEKRTGSHNRRVSDDSSRLEAQAIDVIVKLARENAEVARGFIYT